MKKSFSLLTILVLPALVCAQTANDTKPIPEIKLDRKEPVDYGKDIFPIFKNKCFVCHSGKETGGKLDLSTHAKLMAGGKKGSPIVAGKAEESILYKYCARTLKPIMPPKGEEPLTPNELALLKLWIDQGAKPPADVSTVGTGKPEVVLTLPPSVVKPIRGVAINNDKSLIASGRGNQIHLYKGDGTYVKSLVNPDLKTADGKPASVAHISLVESLTFSPDGKTLVSGSFKEVVFWDVEKGTIKHKLTDFADRVVALHFSSDGKYLATGGGAPTEDGELKVWNAETFKLVVEIKPSHSDTVFGVCFSPDNTKLASCGADKFVKVFEIPSGKFLKSFEGHTNHVMDVGWKPDGKILASAGADNNVKIWDYEKGEQVRTIRAHQNQATRLVFVGKTPTFVTASGDKNVGMFNADSGGNVRSFTGGTDFMYAVAVSSDGKLVITGGEEGILRIYNADNAQLIKAVSPPGEEPKKEGSK